MKRVINGQASIYGMIKELLVICTLVLSRVVCDVKCELMEMMDGNACDLGSIVLEIRESSTPRAFYNTVGS